MQLTEKNISLDLLKNKSLFQAISLKETDKTAVNSSCPYRMTGKHKTLITDTYFYHASLINTSISYLGFCIPTSSIFDDQDDSFLIEMPIYSFIDTQCEPETCKSKLNFGLISSPTEKNNIKNNNCWKLVIRIDKSALEKNLSTLLGKAIIIPITFDPVIDLKSNKVWHEAVKYVTNQVIHLEPTLTSQQLLLQLEQLLISVILLSQKHNYSDEFVHKKTDITPKHIKQAEQYIESNFHKDISLNDLADITGVSIASLCQGFKRYNGVPPIKFLRIIRLEKAHKLLLNATPADNVTNISMKCGFRQPGRFSVYYKKRFGLSPSETIKKSPIKTEGEMAFE